MKINEVLLTCSQALLEAVNFSQVIYPLPGGNQRAYRACFLESGKPANGIRITGVCGQGGGGGGFLVKMHVPSSTHSCEMRS